MAVRNASTADRPDSAETIDPRAFTEALSHLASSVWIATAGRGDARIGRTVTSLMTLSAEPPRLVVSVTHDSALAAAIATEGGFALSMLATGQQSIGDGFAGALPPDQRFAGAAWSSWASGRPRLEGAMVDLDCVLSDTVPAGTHTLFIGTVIGARIGTGTPLLWHRRGYRSFEGPSAD